MIKISGNIHGSFSVSASSSSSSYRGYIEAKSSGSQSSGTQEQTSESSGQVAELIFEGQINGNFCRDGIMSALMK